MNPNYENSSQSNIPYYRDKFETFLSKIFIEKLPAIPLNIKEGIVNFAPYIIGVIILFTFLLFITSLFGVVFISSFSATTGNSLPAVRALLAVVLLAPTIYFEAKAFPNLSVRSKSLGWNYLFYAFLLDTAYSVITLNPWAVIIRLIFLYGLFQIKSFYKE